jgi:D-alanyl-D-alanine carboxypeptidase/D-alanyl-D-alanine-endopeptidase (penicillin-binding protein 4)
VSQRQRRLTVLVATALAVVSGASAAFLSLSSGEKADAATPALAAPVLSPRRAPVAFHELIADTRLSSRVHALLQSLSPTSCAVVRAGDSTILSFKPDQLLMPASALKLTTGAAFLATVGGKDHFRTSVGYGSIRDGNVEFLALLGDGDPLLATPGYATTRKHPPKPETDFTKLATKLHAAGIRHVTGGIIVVDDIYDAERRVPTWSPGYTATGDVGPIGALAVHDGFSSYSPLIAAPDPGIAAGNELRAEVTALGITVDGATRREQISAGRFGNEVHVDSVPFADVVKEMLTESDNNTAELLLKKLVRPHGAGPTATRALGVAARAAALKKLGIDPAGVQAIDGSGLDRSDRATCNVLIETLTTKPGGYDLEQMLAVAGQTGTLDDRFLTSPLKGTLRAKTGSLDDVTALVGVTNPKAKTKLRFAFISNGNFTDAGGKALQDRLVAALATYPEAPPAQDLEP